MRWTAKGERTLKRTEQRKWQSEALLYHSNLGTESDINFTSDGDGDLVCIVFAAQQAVKGPDSSEQEMDIYEQLPLEPGWQRQGQVRASCQKI